MGKDLSFVCSFSADERRSERCGRRTRGEDLNAVDQLE
jgi:hypothetical protein